MRFTKYNSMDDILSYPNMAAYLKIFYSEFLLDMFPKELYSEPLALLEQFGRTPWEEPFSIIVDQLMDAANLILDICENRTRHCISLWDDEEGDWSLERESAGGKNQVFLLSPSGKDKEDGKRRPAAVICPGGGYEAVCFSGEGTPVMHLMEAKGYVVFMLKYRVAPNRYPAPQADLAQAIRYVRCHAAEYGIDPEDILLIGASAGGHLCASEAALYREAAEAADEESKDLSGFRKYQLYSARPDKLCLSYPVISFREEPHEGSFLALTGGDEAARSALSAETLITADYPPSFVWTCRDDDCVPPSNAARMGAALEEKKVPHELHIYPTGGHGCGLAFSKSAYTWSKAMTDFMKKDFSGIRQD